MGSGIEERIRELLATELLSDFPGDMPRVELSGVTVELRVERVVVVLGAGQSKES